MAHAIAAVSDPGRDVSQTATSPTGAPVTIPVT